MRLWYGFTIDSEDEATYNREHEEYLKKMSPYRLSPNTGLMYCTETYGPYVNLTWKCNVEENEDVQSWGELPPPPMDENVVGFKVIGAPKHIGQRLLALPRAEFEDPYMNETMGPYNHTKYEQVP